MSRFLKTGNRRRQVLAVMGVISIFFAFTSFWPLSLLYITAVMLLCVNRIVLHKTNKILELSAKREVKTYDCLVIGSVCLSEILEHYGIHINNTFFLTVPGRSLEASYAILSHTFSLLNGQQHTCIIVHSGKDKTPYSVFDTPYISLVSQKELGLEKLHAKSSFPLFFDPVRSIRILLPVTPKKYEESDCPDVRIKRLCYDKGIRLIYLECH